MSWIANLSYYDFKALGVTDYKATTAIFNNVTNVFLSDDLSIKDFDRVRIDWENALGTPTWWAPVNFKRIAIFKCFFLHICFPILIFFLKIIETETLLLNLFKLTLLFFV